MTGICLLKKLFQFQTGTCFIHIHSVTITAPQLPFTTSKLLLHYSRFACFPTAHNLLDQIPHRDPYHKPDTTITALKACAELKPGRALHCLLLKNGEAATNLFIGSSLIQMYSKCGEMDDALFVFSEYPHPDAVLWTTMITGYNSNGLPLTALDFFSKMVRTNGILLDAVTLIGVVSAFAQMSNMRAGRSVHGYMVRVGLDNRLLLSNSLLNLYGKTGSVKAAEKLFEKMQEKDAISWGSMIACYAHHGRALDALDLFDEMVSREIRPNAVALISGLQACEACCSLERGRGIHKLAVSTGFETDQLVSTALIDMYMSCRAPDEAIKVFNRIPKKDAICYSALLQGCVRAGRFRESLVVFCNMLANAFQPNVYDVVKILTVCPELGSLELIRFVHSFVVRTGLTSYSFICASFIESYAKCGSLDDAIVVFEQMIEKDVVVWSSMVMAYGLHGKGWEALESFHHMIKCSVMPNEASFVCILTACSHVGLVKEGLDIFNLMVMDYKLQPTSKHYGIVVDLLGRVGELNEAMEFINQMPEPVNADIWGALLGACRMHSNTELGRIAAEKLTEINPGQAGYYILLSNMYAADEKWADAAEARKLVKQKKLTKVSGHSTIETRRNIC